MEAILRVGLPGTIVLATSIAEAFLAAWRVGDAFVVRAIALIGVRSITGRSIDLFSLLFLLFCSAVSCAFNRRSVVPYSA
jgi:hypothetical protein